MQTTKYKGLNHISAIICVCGNNFCTFFADSRLLTNGESENYIVNDTTKKIFRFNDNVLYGMTGWYKKDESILAPFKKANRRKLTLEETYRLVLQYAKKIAKEENSLPLHRNYLVGGKLRGRFTVYEIHIDPASREVKTVVRNPQTNQFSISVCLPAQMDDKKNAILNMVDRCINCSRTHSEMIGNVSGVFAKLKEMDDSIGGNIMNFSVF